MTAQTSHRLGGLEPDNLLAFLALVGLMRVLEAEGKLSGALVSWSVDDPPVRPVLHLSRPADRGAVLSAAARGLHILSGHFVFAHRDLALMPQEGTELLLQARDDGTADVWAGLVSDAAASRDGRKLEPTPLCLMFGQGHQHFLSRLASVPARPTPPLSSRSTQSRVSEEECLAEALFERWQRRDSTMSFRWDPREDIRYALRATDPTDPSTRAGTQHGANRLAAMGLPAFIVVPGRTATGAVHLRCRGVGPVRRGQRSITWPIWRHPIGLPALTCLLDHPGLEGNPEERAALGVVELRRAERITNGRYTNVTRAEAV